MEKSQGVRGQLDLCDAPGGLALEVGRRLMSVKATMGSLDSLAVANIIIQDDHPSYRVCTLTGLIYTAVVASNFTEESPVTAATARPKSVYVPNTAFIVMWMDKRRPELDDTCNAIKEVCASSTFRLYVQMTSSIKSESPTLFYSTSGSRNYVHYEIGYAHAFGKHPILYRKEETPLHFDLSVHNMRDYRDVTELKEKLTRGLEISLGLKAPEK